MFGKSQTICALFVQVIEAPCPNGVASNVDPQVPTDAQNPPASESKDTSESYSSQRVPLKSSGGSMMNHEDTLEVHLALTLEYKWN